MEWLTTGGTAGLALAAGLVGALVQHILNGRTQRDRDVAERERLDRQLAAQAEEHRSSRQHAELLSWRDRRFDACRDLATRAADVESLAEELSRRAIRTSDESRHFLAQEEAMKSLRSAHQAVVMLSDAPTRRAAARLLKSADELIRAGVGFSHATTEMLASDDPDFMATVPVHVQRQAERTSKEDLKRFHELAFEMYETSRREFSLAMDEWQTASRLALAVPD